MVGLSFFVLSVLHLFADLVAQDLVPVDRSWCESQEAGGVRL